MRVPSASIDQPGSCNVRRDVRRTTASRNEAKLSGCSDGTRGALGESLQEEPQHCGAPGDGAREELPEAPEVAMDDEAFLARLTAIGTASRSATRAGQTRSSRSKTQRNQ